MGDSNQHNHSDHAMSTRTLVIIVIAVAALLAAGVYMHRPRERAASFPIHGDH